MKRTIQRAFGVIGLGLTIIGFAPDIAAAQTYPNRPIKLIVPFAAGGANDIVARIIQPSLEQALGQPVVVENKPGASGILGTDQVARSEPDGHTMGVALATHSVNPAVNSNMPYDTERDLAPVILVGKAPLMFVVNAGIPAKTMADFAKLAKADPNKYNYATPGAASQAHLIVSQWSNLAGVDIQHIPYRGGGPAIQATVAGEAQFSVMSSLVAAPHVNSGKLRALAVGSPERDRQFPDVPTIMEAGFPDIEAVTWVGLFVPANTPKDIIQRLNSEVGRIIKDPKIAALLAKQGIEPAGGSPEDLQKLVATEIKRWTGVARANGISVGKKAK